MKLRNFNLEDVFGANDVEQAKAYIGKKGYYADSIEDLDDYIENKSHIDKLYEVDEDLGIFRYVIGRSYDYNNDYNYFLPLEKVKKTEPAEKNNEWLGTVVPSLEKTLKNSYCQSNKKTMEKLNSTHYEFGQVKSIFEVRGDQYVMIELVHVNK